ncbi:hypothetical protein B0H10DRAFT_1972860 [Mycena sp. CBHHK59/15]|nr:hypothetical protein B0H10DRAFT_1972860 [Mycena sp. CBHHK59/15]
MSHDDDYCDSDSPSPPRAPARGKAKKASQPADVSVPEESPKSRRGHISSVKQKENDKQEEDAKDAQIAKLKQQNKNLAKRAEKAKTDLRERDVARTPPESEEEDEDVEMSSFSASYQREGPQIGVFPKEVGSVDVEGVVIIEKELPPVYERMLSTVPAPGGVRALGVYGTIHCQSLSSSSIEISRQKRARLAEDVDVLELLIMHVPVARRPNTMPEGRAALSKPRNTAHFGPPWSTDPEENLKSELALLSWGHAVTMLVSAPDVWDFGCLRPSVALTRLSRKKAFSGWVMDRHGQVAEGESVLSTGKALTDNFSYVLMVSNSRSALDATAPHCRRKGSRYEKHLKFQSLPSTDLLGFHSIPVIPSDVGGTSLPFHINMEWKLDPTHFQFEDYFDSQLTRPWKR